jgi:hypothetical protein
VKTLQQGEMALIKRAANKEQWLCSVHAAAVLFSLNHVSSATALLCACVANVQCQNNSKNQSNVVKWHQHAAIPIQ